MKRFNLKEYLANPNRKVVTGDGRNVRILCTDAKINSTHPIIALLKEPNDSESIVSYTEGGQFFAFTYTKTTDLFFAPEKHERWINLYKWDNSTRYYVSKPFDSEEEAMEFGKKDDNYLKTLKIEWEE